MQDDSRPNFPPLTARMGQACYYHSCFKGDAAPLSRCGGCRRAAYCSPAIHQLDWSSHKSLCKTIAKVEASITVSALFADEIVQEYVRGFTKQVLTCLRLSQRLLLTGSRSLTAVEETLIKDEPRCMVCTRTDHLMRIEAATSGTTSEGLIPCPDCSFSFCCSSAHWEAAFALHHAPCDDARVGTRSQCQINVELRTQLRFENVLAKERGHGRRCGWVPARVKAAWTSLEGSTWESEFGDELRKFYKIPAWSPTAPWIRMVSDTLSMAMTILYGLEKLNKDDAWTRKKTLTVHILVGPLAFECHASTMFEEILHRLPEVKTLKIVFCGPTVPERVTENCETCPQCTRRGNKRIHEYVVQTYHQFVERKGSRFEPPDLCVAFNSAVPVSPQWTHREKTYQLLVDRKIPSLFTAYNREEAEMEAAELRMDGATLHPALGTMKNLWGSLHPLPAPHKQYGFYTPSGWVAGGFN
ncbi:hypothetical protein FB45DRAFT_834749 [Roridomyces roridus]|uniref:MYND-type domain-containing protein n=1 Tax=Roridomyces roridus TaxID=1738132 RepID=A0AAD7BRT8_9AGAR|nr:hypothetical protein FB45DRAFT_834749 [Roridomyces roridus]